MVTAFQSGGGGRPNLGLNLILVWSMGGVGLALATSLAASLQFGLAAFMLQQRTGGLAWRDVLQTTGKALTATLVMTAVCVLLRDALPAGRSIGARLCTVAVPTVAGAGVYLAAAAVLKLRDPWTLISPRREAGGR